MRSTTLLSSIALSFTLLATGCVFEETIGPEGPPGPPGNANVFTVNFLFSMQDAIINDNVASVQYEVPSIYASVVDEGAVLLYFREQGTWTAMPYTFAVESREIQAVDYTISMGFGYDTGFLEVFYEASSADIALENQPDREIKAVIIDGFPLGKRSIDLTDYQAVKQYFGLSD